MKLPSVTELIKFWALKIVATSGMNPAPVQRTEQNTVLGDISLAQQQDAYEVHTLFPTTMANQHLRGNRHLEEEVQCYTATMGNKDKSIKSCEVFLTPVNEKHAGEQLRFLLESDDDVNKMLQLDAKSSKQKIKRTTKRKHNLGGRYYFVAETEDLDGTGDSSIYILGENNEMVGRINQAARDGKPATVYVIQPCPEGIDPNCHVKIEMDLDKISATEKQELNDLSEVIEGNGHRRTDAKKTLSAAEKEQEDRDLAAAELTKISVTVLYDDPSMNAIGAKNVENRAILAVETFNAAAKDSNFSDKVLMVLQHAGPAGYTGGYDSYTTLKGHTGSDRKGADISIFISADLSSCGRAYLRCSQYDGAEFNNCPYGVVKGSCVDYFSFAHEAAHILGAQHNIEEFNPSSPYADDHGFLVKDTDSADGYRSIMSYVWDREIRVGMFSVGEDGPSYQGKKMGDKFANNARVIALEAPKFRAKMDKYVGNPQPTRRPTTEQPTNQQTKQPTVKPTVTNTVKTSIPTTKVTNKPTVANTNRPTTDRPTIATTAKDCPVEMNMPDNHLAFVNQPLFATPTSTNQNSFSFAVTAQQNGPAFVRLAIEREFGGPIELSFGEKNLMPNSDDVAHKNVKIVTGDTFDVKYTTATQVIVTVRDRNGAVKMSSVITSEGFAVIDGVRKDFEYSGYVNLACANVVKVNDIECDYRGIPQPEVTKAPTFQTLPSNTQPVFNSDIELPVGPTPRTVTITRGGKVSSIMWLKITGPTGAVRHIGVSGKYGLVTLSNNDVISASSGGPLLDAMLMPLNDAPEETSDLIQAVLVDDGMPSITERSGAGNTLKLEIKNARTGKSQGLVLKGIKAGSKIEFGADQANQNNVKYTIQQAPTKSPTSAPITYTTINNYIKSAILTDTLLNYNFEKLPVSARVNVINNVPDIISQVFEENEQIKDFIKGTLPDRFKPLNSLIQTTLDNTNSGYRLFALKQLNDEQRANLKDYMAKVIRALTLPQTDRYKNAITASFRADMSNSAEFLDAINNDAGIIAFINTDLSTLSTPAAKSKFVDMFATRLNKIFVTVMNHELNADQRDQDYARFGSEAPTMSQRTESPTMGDVTSGAEPRAQLYVPGFVKYTVAQMENKVREAIECAANYFNNDNDKNDSNNNKL